MSAPRIGVLGAGAWGVALAAAQAREGRDVRLWGRDPAALRALGEGRGSAHLPGAALPALRTSPSPEALVAESGIVLCAVPVAATTDLLARALAPPDGAVLLMCSKGIAPAPGAGMGDAPAETAMGDAPAEAAMPAGLAAAAPGGAGFGERIGVLSGPSFAADVARGLPTAVALALPRAEDARRAAGALTSPAFRVYATNDVAGVGMGGALKNVVAIACGIAAGRGLGASAHAALLTRGHAEMRRVARALGARPDTLAGLSGLGDLVLTASSAQSRNFAHGLALGRGEAPPAATVEGVRTAATARALAARLGVRAPVTDALDAILHRGADIDATVRALLDRPPGAEDE